MIERGSKIHIIYTDGNTTDAIFSRAEWGFVFITCSDNTEAAMPVATIRHIQEIKVA